jgi:peptide/nickel transport system permease protein
MMHGLSDSAAMARVLIQGERVELARTVLLRRLRRSFAGFLAGRIALAIFVLWAAYTLSFAILYVVPGDPVSIMLNQGDQGTADPSQVAALRAHYLLDQPLIVQYGVALWRALHLDLGHSIQSGQAVSAMLVQALPATAALSAVALGLALTLGMGIALLASVTRGGWAHSLLLSLPSMGVSLPTFWIGLLLLQFLSFQLGLFPAIGNDGWQSLVLPALTLAIPTAATIAQVLTRSLTGIWQQPFIDALRARGLTRARLLFMHVLPNAAIPALTMTGVIVGNLLAGSVVTETVFSREGIGRLAQGAVSVKDIPVVQGVVLLAAVIFVVINLVVDLLYPILDPRIARVRRQGAP